MIVVEGFDGSGKSTLSKEIAERLGWPVVHTGGPTTDEENVMRCLERSVRRTMDRCVQDRITHISEAVYSMMANPKKSAIALAAIPKLPPVVVIYCRPSDAGLMATLRSHENKAWDTDEHMQRVIATAPQLIAIYDTVMAFVARHMPVIHYNRELTHRKLPNNLVDAVVKRFRP